ncbi:uncharacterized protein PV06_05692 [Exophiala oligosperma]|uniref:Uncharacterized protein n=1 Tax=Exophiala oligosperma TaxID=215243 RepID=A0A0D2BX79_9EURO|nr:uncharacterized protein PV06_05692 [Exophiala oligosperma]KIW42107.1 hypothetical protein PV06_05692 [Exophiala oligosperma]
MLRANKIYQAFDKSALVQLAACLDARMVRLGRWGWSLSGRGPFLRRLNCLISSDIVFGGNSQDFKHIDAFLVLFLRATRFLQCDESRGQCDYVEGGDTRTRWPCSLGHIRPRGKIVLRDYALLHRLSSPHSFTTFARHIMLLLHTYPLE